MSNRHLLRYGTNAGQKYFSTQGFEELYDAVVINANMIAFSPGALANFVVKKTTRKPFFIDPITHAFQHNQAYICNTEFKIKKSISNLIDCYGEELKNIICREEDNSYYPKRRIIPSDIDDSFINSFTTNVLNFQKNVSKEKKVDNYKEYIDFANEEDPQLELDTNLDPKFLVAPYFYLNDLSWLEINISFIEKSKEIENEKEIFAQIVLDKKLIDKASTNSNNDLQKIASKYKNSSADGYLIWIDNYSEHEEITEKLNVYTNFLKDLRGETGKKIFALYGSYFSVILTHKEIGLLDGVCHGLEYGESRSVVPVGGGIPVAKYYFYPLHKRMNESIMYNFLSTDKITNFQSDVCDCAACKKIVDNTNYPNNFVDNFGNTETFIVKGRNGFTTRHYPSTETKNNSLRHYLYMKHKEFDKLDSVNCDDIIKGLRESAEEYISHFNSNDIKHLLEWEEALKNLR